MCYVAARSICVGAGAGAVVVAGVRGGVIAGARGAEAVVGAKMVAGANLEPVPPVSTTQQ